MKSITIKCQSATAGLSESDHYVSPPSTPPDTLYIHVVPADPMSSGKASTWDAGVLKENSSSPVIKSTILISMKAAELIENKGKQNEETTNLLMSPPTPVHPPKSGLYKHSCHTCNIHFPTEKGFEKHMLESEAHRPFKPTSDIAENFGYLSASDTKTEQDNTSPKSLNLPEPILYEYLGRHLFRAHELNQCTKPGCACPQFEFDLPTQPVLTSTVQPGGLLEPFSLDGIAGSTMYGEVRDNEEEDTLDFNLKRPHPPSDEDEGPYIRPPDSDDEEEMAQHRAAEEQKRKDEAAAAIANTETERWCKRQDEADIRRRFSRGKNRRAARISKQRANRAAYEAYVAMDESLFGQQRFEEVVEEEVVIPPQAPPTDSVVWTKEKREAAIANWQREMGQTDYIVEAKKFESELAEQIDSLILDTLFEVALQEDEEKRDKASIRYKNKLFFEDTLEDIAIDHEFGIENKYQEKLRNAAGKEQTKKLNSLRMGDIVDDIAMDHIQEISERGEERYRTTLGRKQTKELNHLRMEDMVDTIAMDHNQEICEREGEHYRRTVGRMQSKRLSDLRMGDLVDDLALDHIQEIGEKDEERHRRNTGRRNNKEFTRLKIDDTVDDLVMIHNQEVHERLQEHQRNAIGLRQTKKLKGLGREEEDIVDNVVMDHFQEVSEKINEHQRKTVGMKQTEQLAALREDNLVDLLVMDHMQGVCENELEHYRSTIGRQQSRNLAANMDDIADNLALEHQKMIDHKQSRKLMVGGASETVKPLANKHNQKSRNKGAEEKRKSEAFLARFLSSNGNGGAEAGEDTNTRSRPRNEKVSGGWYENDGGLGLPKVSVDVGTGHKTSGIGHGTTDPVMEGSSKHDGYGDDGYTSPIPVPKKTIKQKRKEAQAKYDAMINDMAKTQQH